MAAGLLLVALVALYVYYHVVHKRKAFPSGPTPIPLLGNALSLAPLGGDLDKKFIEWRKTFGDIYTIWIGEVRTRK